MMKYKEPNYTITHIGEGQFTATMDNGYIYKLGSSMCGIIRYTYFEDYMLPEIGWVVTRKQVFEDYFPKAIEDVKNGKLKFDQINY